MTVLLNRIEEIAQEHGYLTTLFEAPEAGRLAELLAPRLRGILIKLSRREQAKDLARRGLGTLRAFASAFKVSAGGVDIEVEPESGTADSGKLEADLPELFLAVATAAKASNGGVALFIDEVQYLSTEELSALIVAIHRISQKNLPLILFGAGLPQLAGLAGEAKSYAERLFRYPKVGQLAETAAIEAVQKPLANEGVEITRDALARIVEETQGYPYFLQEWGHHAWDVAIASPITLQDLEQASADALRQLDNDFFRVRFDRLTPREKDYMRSMADLGGGPHRSSDVAARLALTVAQASPLRDGVVSKGMVYSPDYGMVAFTVPMFDSFMRRSMPDWTAPLLDVLPSSPAEKGRRKKKP